ncbi:hypothetical protein KJ762_08590 [bacterium]|nr:hypothetical protein [bacterium]MBU1063852.1 hypothetical protein [bacterium]MBU1634550.1 hypothetical protein [bacterium]MBU1873859.1 hypothetical protein [bacterium]
MKKMVPDITMPIMKVAQAKELDFPSGVTVLPRSLNAEFQKEKDSPNNIMLRVKVTPISKISLVKRELISLLINSAMIWTHKPLTSKINKIFSFFSGELTDLIILDLKILLR